VKRIRQRIALWVAPWLIVPRGQTVNLVVRADTTDAETTLRVTDAVIKAKLKAMGHGR